MPGEGHDLKCDQPEEPRRRVDRLILGMAAHREAAGDGSADALMTPAPECESPERDRGVDGALRIEPQWFGPEPTGITMGLTNVQEDDVARLELVTSD